MKIIFVENRHNHSDLLYSLIIDDLLTFIENNYPKLNSRGNENLKHYRRFKQTMFYFRILNVINNNVILSK